MADVGRRLLGWSALIALAFLGLLLVSARSGYAEQVFYVNPSGASRGTGSASRPWEWPSWRKINQALARDDVTVYFACDQRTESTLEILRVDQSQHRLTLDGMTLRQERSEWVDCLSEKPRTGQGGFTIETSYALRTSNNAAPFISRINWTVRGFTLRARAKIAELSNTSNAILEFCDLAHLDDAKQGPGLHIDNRNASGGNSLWSRNLTIRRNVVHDTVGEAIYINGNKSGPHKGQPSSRGVTIEYNEIYGAGKYGGQGDAIDIKDGVRKLVVRGNAIHDNPVVGIVTDSGGLFERNLIYRNGQAAINFVTIEAQLVNRDNSQFINNICVGNRGSGIVVRGPGSEPDNWTNLLIANNTIAFNNDDGISIDPGAQTEPTVRLVNNILFGNERLQLRVRKAEQLVDHSHNLYGGLELVRVAEMSYSESTLAAFEETAATGDPRFANGGTPSLAEHFALLSPSPALGAGLALSDFDRDYFKRLRGPNWDLGAIATADSSSAE